MMELNRQIDYTLLKPSATERNIIDLCEEAKQHQFYSVCVNSCFVPLAHQILEGSSVKVCSTVGFPQGAMSTEAKAFEAKKAVEDGADEIEMVINIGFLKSRNYFRVLKDISDVKTTIGDIPLVVILEISELSKNEIILASEICLDAKADFIKTSTGFSKSGATLTAVKIIKKTIREKAKIKASGEIRDYDSALKFIDAGASGISSSFSVDILNTKSETVA